MHKSQFKSAFVGETHTKRITYIYNFNDDSIYELWDFIYVYYQHDGKHTAKPIDECPVGSVLNIQKVYKEQKFDNPLVVKAEFRIQCGKQSYLATYVWGLGDKLHSAPWESEQYQPRLTREIRNKP